MSIIPKIEEQIKKKRQKKSRLREFIFGDKKKIESKNKPPEAEEHDLFK